MSKVKYLGTSWAAFQTWKKHWGDLTYENRLMIRDFYKDKEPDEDTKEVIMQ